MFHTAEELGGKLVAIWQTMHAVLQGAAVNSIQHCISTLRIKKNCANLTMAITLSILNRFVNFFTGAQSDKFPTKSILVYPSHLK